MSPPRSDAVPLGVLPQGIRRSFGEFAAPSSRGDLVHVVVKTPKRDPGGG
jgi:hypothetical protein